MYRGKHEKKSQGSVHNILFRAVGILFILTMFTTWLTSGFYAKYVTSDSKKDSARVATTGTVYLWEHKAKETKKNSGIYKLLDDDDNLVQKNKYKKVLPGVDIPKDPFVRLNLEGAEVSYVLYLKVTKSDEFPVDEKYGDVIKYSLTGEWKLTNTKDDGKTEEYVYVGPVDPDSEEEPEPYVFAPGGGN